MSVLLIVLKIFFLLKTLAFLIFLFLSCNFFCFFFQRWDTGALKSTTQLIGIELLSGGTSETTNPLDHMFEHAFMFNRDLSKWKIGPGVLWSQNFFAMIKLERQGAKPIPSYVSVRNALGDPR